MGSHTIKGADNGLYGISCGIYVYSTENLVDFKINNYRSTREFHFYT